MRILLDQGTRAPPRRLLVNDEIKTASEMGWSTLTNGELIVAAETQFDALITTDQGLRYQQVLSGRNLAIIVLSTTSWPRIQTASANIVEGLKLLSAGGFIEISIP